MNRCALLLLAATLAPAAHAQAPEHLVVETFNAGLAYGFVDHAEARRPAILDALAGSEADVVCLQEVWEPEDRAAIEELLGERYPHRIVPEVEQRYAENAPACGITELFGEGRFVSCMTGECGDAEGDAHTDCIIDRCGGALDALKRSNRECATALMAQVGKSAPAALWTVVRPFWHAGIYAYGGSNGLLLLSRKPLEDVGVLDFSDISTLNRRQALYGSVEIEGAPVRVYCTHLSADLSRIAPYPGGFDGWAEENRAQVERLLEHADQEAGPAVMLGDFNCGRADPAHGLVGELEQSCTDILDAGWSDPAADAPNVECTWCTSNRLNAEGGEHDEVVIDHAFLRGLEVMEEGVSYRQPIEIQVDGQPVQTSLSDHYGYTARVQLPQPEAEEKGEAEEAPGTRRGRPEVRRPRPR